MLLHKVFILLWMVDLVVFPILATLELGFSVTAIESNYLVRFSYLTVFSICFVYIAYVKFGIIRHRIIDAFLVVLCIGSVKGLIEMQLNTAFLSHIYYILMPIIMFSYGWFFIECSYKSPALNKMLGHAMYVAFLSGVLAVFIFLYGYNMGFAKYDAVGLSNFSFAGPYLLFKQRGLGYFTFSTIMAFLSGKRGVIAIFIIFIALYFITTGSRSKWLATSTAAISGVFITFLFGDFITSASVRIMETANYIQQGDFDLAFANRLSESVSAINYLISRFDHILVGAGFGARFLPWPDVPDYYDYYSHYTHFSVVSYMWIGGVIFTFYVYAMLLYIVAILIKLIRYRLIEREYYHYAYWLLAVVIASMSGADLMNNPYSWFIIGCCGYLTSKYNRIIR